MTILDRIADSTRRRVALAKARVSPDNVRARCESLGHAGDRFTAALAQPGLSFICELKKASPSKGVISEDFPYLEIAAAYEAAGADALSCLTEPEYFLGSDTIFSEVREQTDLPMLRKDFIVDPYQIYESRVLGADCVLLICALLTERELNEGLRLCETLGLSVLVETHTEDEMKLALSAGARVVGVNNRNLKDFSVEFGLTERLIQLVPEDVLCVAESGVRDADSIRELHDVDAVLVGEALMRADDKAALLREMRSVRQ